MKHIAAAELEFAAGDPNPREQSDKFFVHFPFILLLLLLLCI